MTLTSNYLGLREDPPDTKGGQGWKHYAFTVTLEHEGRTLTTSYRMGEGHAVYRPLKYFEKNTARAVPGVKYNHFGPGRDGIAEPPTPTLADVLSSLVSDAQCWDNARTFEDFASDLGYDADSRKAEKIYQACGQIWKDLRMVLGNALFVDLMTKNDEEIAEYLQVAV